jgi:hypothetical protein
MAAMRYYGNVMTTTKKTASSVYDCTVEDVGYFYNNSLVIDVFYILNSTVID